MDAKPDVIVVLDGSDKGPCEAFSLRMRHVHAVGHHLHEDAARLSSSVARRVAWLRRCQASAAPRAIAAYATESGSVVCIELPA